MGYFPFFEGFAFEEAFLFEFEAAFAFGLAGAFVAALFGVLAFASTLAVFFAAFGGAEAFLSEAFAALFFTAAFTSALSSTVSSFSPSASASMRTTSDHRMWYVDTSEYGITCTFGRFRPERNTFSFTPDVRISTLRST